MRCVPILKLEGGINVFDKLDALRHHQVDLVRAAKYVGIILRETTNPSQTSQGAMGFIAM